jgi:hypothetical protein
MEPYYEEDLLYEIGSGGIAELYLVNIWYFKDPVTQQLYDEVEEFGETMLGARN